MFKYLSGSLLLLIACTVFTHLSAQALPAEGSSLNYRIVGFSFASSQGAQKKNKYKIEIAAGNYNNADSFKRHIVRTVVSKKSSIIAELPSFDMQYTWRITNNSSAIAGQQSTFHHFATAAFPNVDTGLLRLRILKAATKYKDAYVFLDANRALYDMSGQPVWFLPKVDSSDNVLTGGVSDLEITPQGTITFLRLGSGAYEVDYNAKVLWKAPDNGAVSGGTSEHYHHEFTRLPNGHYMALGNEIRMWKAGSANDSVFASAYDKETKTYEPGRKIDFPTVTEYDGQGNVLWCWKSSTYFQDLWLRHHHDAINYYNDVHANAFFMDEKEKCLYVSFKNINQIVKVKYPEGVVLNDYNGWDPDTDVAGKVSFCMQHACKVSDQGYLYFFDNNVCQPAARPRIVIAEQPAPGKGSLKEVWSYQYPVEVMNNKTQIVKGPVRRLTVGGNVIELPDHSIFASLCEPYNNIFIVNKDKKIVWSAVAERRNARDKNWSRAPQYRASIIKNRRELERLIMPSPALLNQIQDRLPKLPDRTGREE